jgi:hypothetical protein
MDAGGDIERIDPRRARLVVAAVVLLVAISLFEIATGREDWPFSAYTMYSVAVREPSLTRMLIFGVPADASREFPIASRRQLAPFDQSRLDSALTRLAQRPNAEPLLREAVRDVLARYERRRTEGRHDGPRLRGARLYEVAWTLRPDASNVERPERRTLLVETRAAR